jgi:hypothetical protein
MAKETAEEKLLKMMKKSSPATASTAAKKKFKFAPGVDDLNKVLFVGIIVCAVILVFEMQSGISLLHQPVSFPEPVNSASESDISLPATPSADYYLRPVSQRDIFKPYVPPAAKKISTINGITQLMAKYKLVGISWLDLPETACVMIEDIKKHETYFLKQGEQLDGVTVKTIYTDRAVFSHENEETTIKL